MVGGFNFYLHLLFFSSWGYAFITWGMAVVATGRIRLVCFSPARASGRIKRTVIHKAKVAGIVGAGLARRTARSLIVTRSTLTVVIIPMCKNHMTPLTVSHLTDIHKDGAPTIVIIMCNGHTCRGSLVRLSC